MPHNVGTGPAYATASVFVQGTRDYADCFSDVGLTLPVRNPLVLIAGAYDFYTAEDVYVAVGVETPIYESSDGPGLRVDEYLAPSEFP